MFAQADQSGAENEPPAKVSSALRKAFGDQLDRSQLQVRPWERWISAEESYKVDVDGMRLAVVCHDDGDNAVYLRRMIGLYFVANTNDIARARKQARRDLLIVEGLIILWAVLLVAIVMGIINGQQSISVSIHAR